MTGKYIMKTTLGIFLINPNFEVDIKGSEMKPNEM